MNNTDPTPNFEGLEKQVAPVTARYEAIMLLRILTPKQIDSLVHETFRKEHHFETHTKFISNNYLPFNEYFENSMKKMNKNFSHVFEHTNYKEKSRANYLRHQFLDQRKKEYAHILIESGLIKKAEQFELISKKTYLNAIQYVTPNSDEFKKQLVSLADPYARINIIGADPELMKQKEEFYALYGTEIRKKINKITKKVYTNDISVFDEEKIKFTYI